ncbi:MAG TPA: trehalase family glycosidase [Prolixibacteraceae bacterium]|nr:trehalase family glycosidase [Prolixibacteraceae bacterium]
MKCNIVFKMYVLVIFLSLTSVVFGQHIADITFDIKRVPFSRYGSYMAVSTREGALNLLDLTGREIWENRKAFRIEAIAANKVIPMSYVATPVELTGTTENGKIKFYFESQRIIHILGSGQEIRLTGNFGSGNLYAMPGHTNSWVIRDKSIVISAKKGNIRFQENEKESTLMLEKDINGEFDIVIEQSFAEPIRSEYTESYKKSLSKVRKEIQQWYSKMPSVPNQYEEAAKLAAYINWSCVYEPRGNIKRYGMAMSKTGMPYIWSWDHCFNALSLSYHKNSLSWDQYMVIFDNQDPKTGALPDLISSQNSAWACKKPPIHGWILSELLKQYKLNDVQLKGIYEQLSMWTEYWFRGRDEDGNGLPQYNNGYDSGWDNGTAFDKVSPVEGADLAAFLVLQMEELSRLAEKLNKPEDAVYWKEKANSTLDKMIKNLWDGEKFITRNVKTFETNKESKSLMSYLPILLGKRLPENIRTKMINDLKQKDYLITDFGPATESPSSKLYEDDGYWRGPIWAPTTLILIEGLNRCGEEQLAKEIARKFCDMCNKSGFAENFDSLTGAPLRDPAYTWTTSVFMVLANEYVNK